jgi:hypothetical protein
MSIRFSRVAIAVLAVAVVLTMAGRSWAIYNGLGPDKDEWGLKYDVAVNDAGGDKATVTMTLADEGRLKPFYSVEVIALSKEVDNQGGHSYDVKAPLKFQPTGDGKSVAQVQIKKNVLDRAKIRILSLNFDGQRSTYAWNYDIPLLKYWDKVPTAPLPVASPPATNVTK